MKDQSFHRSQALEVKLKNLEDVSEEREMSGSISLNRQSAKSWEVLTRMDLGRLRAFNRDIVCLTGKTNKIWINLEEL
jgi:hypothetical protein